MIVIRPTDSLPVAVTGSRQLTIECKRGAQMNVKILYETPILKIMNVLVFLDTFILIAIRVGFMGDSGIAIGVGYGLAGGIAAILMFNVLVFAVINFTTHKHISQ